MSNSDDAKAVEPGNSYLGAGSLTAISRATSQGSQLVIFIFAARALSPADFGVFAIVSACAMLLLRLAEAGWPEFIMSWRGDEVVPRQVLTIACLAGVGSMIAGLIVTAILWMLGSAPDLVLLAGLFALWIMLATISAALTGVLIWQNKLKQSALVYLIGELTGLVVAVAALYAGFGVLALIYGRLAHQIVQLASSLMFCRMRPAARIEGSVWREVRSFCMHILASRVVSNIRMYASTFIIGGFLGPAAVGYFRAAQRLVAAFGEIIGEPTRVLAWGMFKKAQSAEQGSFNKIAVVFFPVLMALAIPVFLWIAIFSVELTIGLLGAQWAPTAPLIVVLAFAQLAIAPSFATEAIISLAGFVKKIPLIATINAVLSIVVTVIAAPYGVMAVAVSQAVVAVVFLASSIWMQEKYADIRWREVVIALWYPLIAIGISGVILLGLARSDLGTDWHPLLRVVVLTLPAMAIYTGLMAALFREEATKFLRQVSPKPNRKSA